MPLTTTALWPDLVAGRKAKASEVEAKFDWLEGSLFPHNSGNATNNAYDIGTSTYNFRTGYFGTSIYAPALNPTTTASGIAIGKDTADASSCLDLSAMPKAIILPVLTTTQRTALTPSEGMIIYNSTNSRMERYEGGQWIAMNNPIGLKSKVVFPTVSTTYVDALNVTGSGRLLQVVRTNGNAGAGETETTSLIIDSATYTSYILATATGTYIMQRDPRATSSSFIFTTTASTPLDIEFRNSLQIQMKKSTAGGNNDIIYILYELSV